MKFILVLLIWAATLSAQESEKWHHIWEVSVATQVAAQTTDVVTSYGLREGNPLLGQKFDGRSVAIKSGIVGTSIGLQILLIHRHPRLAKTLSFVNFGTSAGLAGVAWHNMKYR